MKKRIETLDEFINESKLEDNIFYKDIIEFKDLIEKKYQKFVSTDDLQEIASNVVYEEIQDAIYSYIEGYSPDVPWNKPLKLEDFENWTEKDMDKFIDYLNKRVKNFKNLTKEVWDIWIENEVAYRDEIEDLERRRQEAWDDMDADPETEPEGGPVADAYAEEIEDLDDKIEKLRKEFSYESKKKEIEKQLKTYEKEILNLIKKEL